MLENNWRITTLLQIYWTFWILYFNLRYCNSSWPFQKYSNITYFFGLTLSFLWSVYPPLWGSPTSYLSASCTWPEPYLFLSFEEEKGNMRILECCTSTVTGKSIHTKLFFFLAKKDKKSGRSWGCCASLIVLEQVRKAIMGHTIIT